ncbi:hypothetical protein [Actinoplanes sp. NBRC 103695]|nr:hypothetical protein [Actinoplanes sp. NBRC 103695]GLZ01804.1 hypothetical protein Acsp02_90550 [Actinoplanes sp. NBRC 103695]
MAVGTTVISDGASLAPFKSMTQIHPPEVGGWNVRLVGLDADRSVA